MAKHQQIDTQEAEFVATETTTETGGAVAVSRTQAVAQAPTEYRPSLLEQAIAAGASFETLERLMAMQERLEANAARQAFDSAIANAKAEIGPIEKNRRVLFESAKGKTDYRFEDLAAIAAAVDPVLSKFGLSYRYRTAQAGGMLTVTCILSHRDGYSEETTLQAGYDTSGNKNTHQGIGSALTYLQRYTLKAALGLAVAHDNDGQTPAAQQQGPAELSAKQAAELADLVKDTGTELALFLKAAKAESIADIKPANFAGLRARLLEKKSKAAKADPAPVATE